MPLIRELRRRHVFRVAAAYVVVSWLLVQVADILLPTFAAPEWVMRALVLTLAAGLPVTLVLAWVFDLTPQGIERTHPGDGAPAPAPLHGGALNFIIIGVLAAALALFALDRLVFERPAGVEAPATRPSLAVLPFQNFSGDAVNEPFAHGLHDDLLTQLSKIDAIDVASRTSVMRYRETTLSVPEIARELNVTAVLEGSVQRSADRVRLNAQLIDGRSDKHLWAETFDRELTAANVFAIQSEVARSIARALRATLTPGELASLDAVPTEHLDAYDAYAAGRMLLQNRTADNVERAIESFEEATRIDPEFAAAWAATCEARLSQYSKSSDTDVFDLAERACTRALTLDGDRAEVHLALGYLYLAYGESALAEQSLKRAQLDKAEQALRAALGADALMVDAYIGLGEVYAEEGRLQEAEAELRRALALQPDSAQVHQAFFSFYYGDADHPDRFALAEASAQRAADLDPGNVSHWNNLGSARYMQADYAGASEAWQHSLALEPSRTGYTNTGLAMYYAGDFEGAARMQRKASELAPDDHRPLGRLGEALAMLEGREEDARAAFTAAAARAEAALAINERDWRSWGMLAIYRSRVRDIPGSLDAAGRALELSERRAEALFYAAQAQVAANRSEVALDLLLEAVEKDPAYVELAVSEPSLEPLTRDPRFQALAAEKPAD